MARVEHKLFTWDCKQQPPLKEMLAFAAQWSHLKHFQVNDGSDQLVVLFARNIKDARKHVKEYYRNEDADSENEVLKALEVTPISDELT